jgi:hypothetical protein
MRNFLLLFIIGLTLTLQAQIMLPAYQGVFNRKIITSSVIASNGLDFDGNNDYVATGTIFPVATGDWTIETWIRPSSIDANYHGILGSGDVSVASRGPSLYIYNNDVHWDSNYGGTRYDMLTTGDFFSSGEWTHLAWVKSGNTYTLYRNGIVFTTGSAPTTVNPGAITYKQGTVDSYNFFNGSLDDLRIWNVVRTQAEIQTNMNSELLGTETGLKAYYTFNQGIAAGNNTAITTVTDRTVNALNGTLNNFSKTGANSNFVVGKVESSIITSGLGLNLDARNSASFPSSGTSWNDISGNGITGTLHGPTFSSTVNSQSNPSLYFNGNGQYIDFGTSPTNFPTGNISVSVWVNFSTLSNASWNIFMTKWFGGTSSDFHYSVKFNGTSYKQNLYTTSNSDMYGSSIISANTWYCLGFTLQNNGNLQFYVNGIPDGSFTNVSRTNGNSFFYLGDNRPGNGLCFTGYLSGVNLYNRTLTQAEMLNNYNALKGLFGY